MCSTNTIVTESHQGTLTCAVDKILCIQRNITSGTLTL